MVFRNISAHFFSIFLFLLIFFHFSFTQNQYCTHLSGTGLVNEDQYYGTEYQEKNSIGSMYWSESFLITNSTELLVFYGFHTSDYRTGYSNQIWKYSIEKSQWKFVDGTQHSFNKPSSITEINNFSGSISIGSRGRTKGWIDEETNIVSFFGGYGFTDQSILGTINEFWRYNISSNFYSVMICNDCGVFSSSKEGQILTSYTYAPGNYPKHRADHEIVQITTHELLIVGGEYKEDTNLKITGDWWIFSTELMQFKYMGGIDSTESNFTDLNIYHPDNRIGPIYGLKGLLINEEEILFFGGKKAKDATKYASNELIKYNYTNNQWKKIHKNTWNGEYGREYNDFNLPKERYNHKIWRINEIEIGMFGGTISSGTYLNDEFFFNLDTLQWKFTGKEQTISGKDNYAYFRTDGSYSEDTIIGGTAEFNAHYISDQQRLIVCNGIGLAKYGTGKIEDCYSFYYGKMCNLLKDTDPEVCLKRGKCSTHNQCSCNDGYYGSNCELTKCNGILSNETESVCSGKGLCYESTCLCFVSSEYNKPDCTIDTEQQEKDREYETFLQNLWIYITIPVIIFCLIVFFLFSILLFLVICCRQKKKLEKFDEIEDIDIILEEQKIAKDTSIAHFKINQDMFIINTKDIKILEVIGQGGSSAYVYLAIWNQQKVAYKCFVVHDFLEEKFKEFEKEVALLSSISFPFILTFYGATLNTQRLGFVMEYAENGDLEIFLRKNQNYPFRERIRMLYEISTAMLFLHKKKVIHRDLKPSNVLVTSNEETKLMDFGLSTIVDNDLTKTKSVGTSFYIAPEVISGHYSFPCDVFSFAMVMFVVLTGNFAPFSSNSVTYNIFVKVSKNPNFRPDLRVLDKKLKGNKKEELIKMIKTNWSHKASNRMKFKEISELLLEILNDNKKITLSKKKPIDGVQNENKTIKGNWKKRYEILKSQKNKEIAELKREIRELKKGKK